MKKDFIKDNGKIRMCDSNIAKMNIFEYMRYIYGWKSFVIPLPKLEEFLDSLELLLYMLLYIPMTLFAPFIHMYSAYHAIKHSRKEVKAIGHFKRLYQKIK